jgi:hypothetical protein
MAIRKTLPHSSHPLPRQVTETNFTDTGLHYQGKRQPLHKITDGRLSASIWENQMQDGPSFYGVTFSHFYKQGDTIRGSASFGKNDLLRVAKLATCRSVRS